MSPGKFAVVWLPLNHAMMVSVWSTFPRASTTAFSAQALSRRSSPSAIESRASLSNLCASANCCGGKRDAASLLFFRLREFFSCCGCIYPSSCGFIDMGSEDSKSFFHRLYATRNLFCIENLGRKIRLPADFFLIVFPCSFSSSTKRSLRWEGWLSLSRLRE